MPRPRAQPIARDRDRNVEDEGQVRCEPAGGGVAERLHLRKIKLSSVPLVRECRVDETVAEHPFPACDRREYRLLHMLRPSSVHQERFRHRHNLKPRFEKDATYEIPDNGTAGFSRDKDCLAVAAQSLGKPGKKGALATSFNTFDRDEHPGRASTEFLSMSFGGSMFNDVIEWFLGRGDRRQYKRRARAFPVWWQQSAGDPKSLKAGIGLELSPNGLQLMLPDAVPSTEFNLVRRVRDQAIPARVKSLRTDQVPHQGKTWHRYNGEFLGIAADHWDLIVRYVDDVPEPQNKAAETMEKADDAYRLLPLIIQQKIVAMLVSAHKLEEPKAGQTPLLKLFYGGIVKQAGKKPAHRFNVHSRVLRNDEILAFDTRFLIADDGEITMG